MAWLERRLVRMRRGMRYTAVLLAAGFDAERRQLAREIWQTARQLPRLLDQPLPDAMAALSTATPADADATLPPDTVRQIVDALTAFGAGRPLGLCLRRSLLRYFFLRRAGLPVVVHFGARRLNQDVSGHAWLTLAGLPYHERPEHFQHFTVMFSYPPANESSDVPPANLQQIDKSDERSIMK